jgi:hypothetical protein
VARRTAAKGTMIARNLSLLLALVMKKEYAAARPIPAA